MCVKFHNYSHLLVCFWSFEVWTLSLNFGLLVPFAWDRGQMKYRWRTRGPGILPRQMAFFYFRMLFGAFWRISEHSRLVISLNLKPYPLSEKIIFYCIFTTFRVSNFEIKCMHVRTCVCPGTPLALIRFLVLQGVLLWFLLLSSLTVQLGRHHVLLSVYCITHLLRFLVLLSLLVQLGLHHALLRLQLV